MSIGIDLAHSLFQEDGDAMIQMKKNGKLRQFTVEELYQAFKIRFEEEQEALLKEKEESLFKGFKKIRISSV